VPARTVRAGVFAASSGCLATAAHTAAGGDHPSAPVLLVAVALIARIAYGFAGRERGVVAIAAGVGACQLAIHLTIVLAALERPAGHAGVHDHLPAVVPTAPVASAHALAAGFTVVALRRAERALWATAALRERLSEAAVAAVGATRQALARLGGLLSVCSAAVPARPPRRGPGAAEPSRPAGTSSMLGRASRRRGPPGPAETGRMVPAFRSRSPSPAVGGAAVSS
jgi:hypothetical protein